MTIIRIVDLETNGLAPPAEVLQLGVCDLTKRDDGEWIVGLPSDELFSILAPLDPAARAAHHIRPTEIEWLLKAALESGVTGREMVAWTKEPPLHTRWPVGKWRGTLVTEIPADYFDWVLRDKGMDPNLKWNARREIDRRALEKTQHG